MGRQSPRSVAVSLILPLGLASVGCASFSTSHGPRPLDPDERVFGLGASVIRDFGQTSELLVLPELSYRGGLTEQTDFGVKWAGYTLMVDVLRSFWDEGPWVLSGGVGASVTGLGFFAVHPEVYFGTDHLFLAARTAFSPGSSRDAAVGYLWPGLSLGALVGDPASVHVLPSVSAYFDATTTLVFTVTIRSPSRQSGPGP